MINSNSIQIMLKLRNILIAILLLSSNTDVFAWGVYGHQHINKAAIYALPAEIGIFFYVHTDFITEESVVPDIRKYTMNDNAEFPRHYIDLEAYNYTSPTEMPQTMDAAKVKYNNDTMQKYGILPWYIQDMMEKLTKAFKEKQKAEILFLAADLGHYIADAQMPLHTSLNHNGQLSGQKGIHAFWESQLPEMFGSGYNLHVENAHYIDNITKTTWDFIAYSHKLADTLLSVEKTLLDTYPKDKIYLKDAEGKEVKNKYNQPIFSDEFAAEYHKQLNGMVEKQMKNAITHLSDFWYTAWVNAGKPDLRNLDTPSTIEEGNIKLQVDKVFWQKGQIPGLKTNNEFK